MKQLFLLRHCKSDWSASMQRDYDRPLNERGKSDAPLVCSFINSVISFPETKVAVSPAVRTRQTVAPLIKPWTDERKNKIDFNESLYESGLNEYLKVIRQTPDSAENLLIVGHNPAISDVVEFLVSGHRLDELVHVSTGTLIALDLNVSSWKQTNADNAVIRFMIPPKILKKAQQL